MDCFTIHNLLPGILVYSTCYEDKTEFRRKEQTTPPRAQSEARGPCKVAALAAASVASLSCRPVVRYQQNATDEGGTLSKNLNENQMVGCVTTGTLQDTQGVCAEEMAVHVRPQ
jgi:hypothetical protein